jgi:Rieske Fe-S protein
MSAPLRFTSTIDGRLEEAFFPRCQLCPLSTGRAQWLLPRLTNALTGLDNSCAYHCTGPLGRPRLTFDSPSTIASLMRRRTLLIWFGRSVYTACAAVVAAPIARLLALPAAAKTSDGGPVRRRIATLDSLSPGQPQLIPVMGTRQDAWVRHPDQVIGRVWVTRLSPPETPPEQTALSVFNAACPHSGCPIQQAMSEGYVCHCHGAKFEPDGSLVPSGNGFINPSPRGMDPLEHRVVKDEATDHWWVEVEYKDFEIGIPERVAKA